MIPWFYSQSELKKFKDASQKKQERIILQQRENVYKQKLILEEKSKALKLSAKDISRRVKRGDTHRATESMMSVAFDLENSEPVLTNYVNNLLLLRVYEVMHIQGYENPSALPAAMDQIDYGLYSLSTEDELQDILRQSTDPLAIIGISIEN